MESAVPIINLGEIPHREEINITGGEPVESPFLLEKMVHEAKVFGFQRIYVYASRYDQVLERILPNIHGIHYTLHTGATHADVLDFLKMQGLAYTKGFDKSFRVALSPDIDQHIPILPAIWREVRIKHWRNEEECIVPVDEQLFRLQT
jgi:hypothetical protein